PLSLCLPESGWQHLRALLKAPGPGTPEAEAQTTVGVRGTVRLQRAARAAKRGEGAKGALGFPPAQRLHLGRETGGTDPMTRRGQIHQRLVQVLPAEVLLTPGTFDEEIALTPVLVARLQRAGVLAQTSALLPGLAGS